MKNNLKCCPFCGGEAELHIEAIIDDNGDVFDERYYIQCVWCHSQTGRRYDKEKALAIWNRKELP